MTIESVEPLDAKTAAEWRRLSARTLAANLRGRPSRMNGELEAAAGSQPQSPVAPAYRLWIAHNLIREARYGEAVRALDAAIETAQTTRRFIRSIDPIACALRYQARAALLSGDRKLANSTYEQLARVSAAGDAALSEEQRSWIEGRSLPAGAAAASVPFDEPLSFELLAPWPAGLSFKAGGLYEFIGQQAAIMALAGGGWLFGPLGGLIGGAAAAILLGTLAASPCGFGLRGFYYDSAPTHNGVDGYAIDFTRYRRFVPYDNESAGTPVLAVRDGVVADMRCETPSGESPANYVELAHADPDNPLDLDRYHSRYLHLDGPMAIPVAPMMAVRTGQRLGRMDNTGRSAISHLHFSFHDRNVPYPGARYGRSVRPSPLDGERLGDLDGGKCMESTNLEFFAGQTGQLLFYRDENQNGTGDVHDPDVIGLGGWQLFKFLFAGGNGVLYAVDQQGRLLFYRDAAQDGTGELANPSVIGLGGWQNMQFVFSGGNGIIYAVDDQGQLLFYRDATQDGTGDVANPSVIGLGGWQVFRFLFSAGNGIIYAVDDQGQLLFYRDAAQDGTGDVSSPSVIGLGGWQFLKFVLAGDNGILHAVDEEGQLLFYRDTTQNGTGDVASPSVIGSGGWQFMRFLTSGGGGILYAVPA